MKKLIATVAVTLGLTLSFASGYAIGAPELPNCPTEDSCAYSYDNGSATVIEVTP